jgi:CP family cyanate transporter-like MFS transporter
MDAVYERVAVGMALTRRGGLLLALLWLGGLDLRLTVLAVPPVIPAIHHDLGLDEKGISALTALPTLLLAAAAIPGAALIARVGARRALVVGLTAIAVFSALRGVGTTAAVLFPMTLLMGAGVAVSQPTFPTLTREWFPRRVGLATAVYSNGLLFGEAIPAALTGTVVMPLLHQSWPWSLAFWSVPVAATALLVVALTREQPADAVRPEEVPRRWWPDFRHRQTWLVGLVMGLASASYFGANAFVPDFLHATGQAQLTNAALTAINTCQLLASVLMLAFADRLVGRRLPFIGAAVLLAAGLLGAIALPGAGFVASVGLVGLASALALVLTLALPPLLAAPADVPRFSAGVFAIQYSCSFVGPVIGGAAWDATGVPAASFAALAAGAGLMAALAAVMPLKPAPGAPARSG